jgi:hypothetical protein
MSPYSVLYTFEYPIIVMVEDSRLDQWFKFAIMVNIENTQVGQCDAGLPEESEYAKVCGNAECDARVSVKNTTGDAIKGADVSFYICDLGVTDSSGVVEGKIPCMASELHVYKNGYRSFGDLFRSDELEDKTVIMEKISENITIHLKGLRADAKNPLGDGRFGDYGITDGPEDLSDSGRFDDTELVAFISFAPSDPNPFTGEDSAIIIANFDADGNLVSEINITGLQPIPYGVTASVSDNETGRTFGFLNSSITLGQEDSEIYVYLPVALTVDGSDWGDEDSGVSNEDADKMTEKVKNYCGAPPVSTTETC